MLDAEADGLGDGEVDAEADGLGDADAEADGLGDADADAETDGDGTGLLGEDPTFPRPFPPPLLNRPLPPSACAQTPELENVSSNAAAVDFR